MESIGRLQVRVGTLLEAGHGWCMHAASVLAPDGRSFLQLRQQLSRSYHVLYGACQDAACFWTDADDSSSQRSGDHHVAQRVWLLFYM